MSNSSILLIDRTLSVATTLGQSGPGSDGNEVVLRIPQSSSISGTSPLDCLVSYPGHSLEWGSCPSAEMQLVYSTAPANWANVKRGTKTIKSLLESWTVQWPKPEEETMFLLFIEQRQNKIWVVFWELYVTAHLTDIPTLKGKNLLSLCCSEDEAFKWETSLARIENQELDLLVWFGFFI